MTDTKTLVTIAEKSPELLEAAGITASTLSPGQYYSTEFEFMMTDEHAESLICWAMAEAMWEDDHIPALHLGETGYVVWFEQSPECERQMVSAPTMLEALYAAYLAARGGS